MKKNITEKQNLVLQFIIQKIKENGYPPSVREICAGIGVSSTSTVQGYLDRLENAGLISRADTKNRSIKIIGESNSLLFDKIEQIPMDYVNIPILGNVTAGIPILATENVEDYMPMPTAKVSSGNHFMLKIVGESMIEAGIHDKDLVLVKQQGDAKNGDIVVALLEDSATVKTFYKEKDYIRLQPENSSFMPIVSKDVKILGIVKGVFRFI